MFEIHVYPDKMIYVLAYVFQLHSQLAVSTLGVITLFCPGVYYIISGVALYKQTTQSFELRVELYVQREQQQCSLVRNKGMIIESFISTSLSDSN